MIKTLCALRNRETGLFCDPFISLSQAQAIRRFEYACSIDYQSDIFHECANYDLELLGEFDDVTGELVPEQKLLLRGMSMVELRDQNRDKYYKLLILEKESQTEESPA